jgi:predicted RNA-binding protein with PUA-like domain
MQYWLMKTEPDTFSIHDLKRVGKSEWEGVRNYQARNFMQSMQVGDRALLYHSNAGAETGVAGEMRVATGAQPDSAQFKPNSPYFDAASTKDKPRWWCVVVEYAATLPRVVTLEELKADAAFSDSRLTMKGNRLSVVPLTKKQYERVITLSKQTA